MASERKLAIIEMAEAAGLTLVPKDERDPKITTTYGVGERILHETKMGDAIFLSLEKTINFTLENN